MNGILLSVALPIALAGFAVALAMNAWRLLIGPSAADRVLALDTLYVNSLALLILIGIQFQTPLFFEVALMIGMIGFIGTVALAKYITRGDIAE